MSTTSPLPPRPQTPYARKTVEAKFGFSGFTVIAALIVGACVGYYWHAIKSSRRSEVGGAIASTTSVVQVASAPAPAVTPTAANQTAVAEAEILLSSLLGSGQSNIVEALRAYALSFTNAPAVPALTPVARVVGRVVNVRGEPVPTAVVRLGRDEVEVSLNGYFSLPLFTESGVLEVTAPRYFVWRGRVTAEEPTATVVLDNGQSPLVAIVEPAPVPPPMVPATDPQRSSAPETAEVVTEPIGPPPPSAPEQSDESETD